MLHTCVHIQNSLRCIANVCMNIHSGSVFIAPRMCTYTKRSLCCIAHVYVYTLRIGFHRSTHVYIHKTQLALHYTCVCVYTEERSSQLHTCVHTQELVMLHTCVHIQSSLRCIANVCMNIHSGSIFIAPRMCTYTNAACAALHMCMCIHSGSVFIAPRMCIYTNAACAALHMCMNIHSGSVFTAPRMCTYTKQLTLHCTCV